MSTVENKKLSSELKFVYSENGTLSVIFQNNDLLLGVVGEFNDNLKELEKITDTSVEGILSTTDKIYNVDTTDYNVLVSYIQKNEIKKAIEKFKKMLPEYKVDVKNKY